MQSGYVHVIRTSPVLQVNATNATQNGKKNENELNKKRQINKKTGVISQIGKKTQSNINNYRKKKHY